MNLLRQHTDYAFRMLVALGQTPGELIATRALAAEADVPYQFASKIMQKLHEGRIVESVMGPRGGFRIARPPRDVNLLEIIELVQGPLVMNTCLLGEDACPRRDICPVSEKLDGLQAMMVEYLRGITLADLLAGNVNLAGQNMKGDN